MRIIARRTLREFVVESLAGHRDQPAVDTALSTWFHMVRTAEWRNTASIRAAFAKVSIISADRVVFNIKGNSYRLVVAIDFEKQIVWIKWIGTHKDYDKIDVATVEYER
jgi:mRNA interferase HigB